MTKNKQASIEFQSNSVDAKVSPSRIPFKKYRKSPPGAAPRVEEHPVRRSPHHAKFSGGRNFLDSCRFFMKPPPNENSEFIFSFGGGFA